MKSFLGITTLFALTFAVYADNPQNFTSTNEQTHIIELYTSEGCSSCPPADRWLSGFKNSNQLWNTFIPLAFHVDYWDYLGWNDGFARREFSQRQRRYDRIGHSNGVYTPGMFLDSKEWRTWRYTSADSLPIPSTTTTAPSSAGILQLAYRQDAPSELTYTIDHSQNAGFAYMALLGTDIHSQVNAGENRGKKLTHDFVVLDLARVRLEKSTTGFRATLPPLASDVKAKYAIAIWVTDENDGIPLQATGGWIESR